MQSINLDCIFFCNKPFKIKSLLTKNFSELIFLKYFCIF